MENLHKITTCLLIENIIVFILCLVNLFLHSVLLTYFNAGALIMLVPMLMLILNLTDKEKTKSSTKKTRTRKEKDAN